MEPIIDPVDIGLLKEEFSRAPELTEASRGDIKVYCIDSSFPNILREVGRLREIAFRKAISLNRPTSLRIFGKEESMQ